MLGSGALNYPKIPPQLKGIKKTRTSNTISLGLECLDKLVEDGIPFPSMILIDERKSKKFSRIITRIFIAEGIQNENKILISNNLTKDVDEILNSIPQELSSNTNQNINNSIQKMQPDQMKIAWRYNTAPQVGVQNIVKERFDLAKSHERNEINDTGLIDYINITTLDELEKLLINELNDKTVDITSASSDQKVVRICLPNLISFLYDDFSTSKMLSLLIKLKAYIMTSTAVLFVTIDGNLLDKSMLNQMYSLFDTIFVFHTENNLNGPAGRLEIAKLPRCYGTAPFRRENCDYTYKDTRHTIEIKKLHLDPEGIEEDVTAKSEPLLPKLKELGVLATEDED